MSRAKAMVGRDHSQYTVETRPVTYRGITREVSIYITDRCYKSRVRKGQMSIEDCCFKLPAVSGAKGSPLFNGEGLK